MARRQVKRARALRNVVTPFSKSGGSSSSPAVASDGRRRPSGLINSYDFRSFVIGPNNQFARAPAMAVASQPGTLYNPFFLFGGAGLGKTHLVNAIGNSVLDTDPARSVLFMSADTFSNRLIEAIAASIARIVNRRQAGDHAGARREAHVARIDLLGPVAPVVDTVDSRTAGDLIGDPWRLSALARLVLEDAETVRAMHEEATARALELLRRARGTLAVPCHGARR